MCVYAYARARVCVCVCTRTCACVRVRSATSQGRKGRKAGRNTATPVNTTCGQVLGGVDSACDNAKDAAALKKHDRNTCAEAAALQKNTTEILVLKQPPYKKHNRNTFAETGCGYETKTRPKY